MRHDGNNWHCFLFIPPIGSQSSGIPSRHELPWLSRDQSTLPIIPNIHNLSARLNHESNESETFDNDPSTPGSSTRVIRVDQIKGMSTSFDHTHTLSPFLSLSRSSRAHFVWKLILKEHTASKVEGLDVRFQRAVKGLRI